MLICVSHIIVAFIEKIATFFSAQSSTTFSSLKFCCH